MPVQRKARRVSRISAALLIGLVVVVIAGGVLGSFSLLAHFGVIGATSTTAAAHPVRGGTWTDDYFIDPGGSLIPSGGGGDVFTQALYLPLFYGDAQGMIQPGAATEVPDLTEWGHQSRWQDLDIPHATTSRLVGWAAVRCPRRGLHLEALDQSEVRRLLARASQPDHLGRCFSGRPLDYLPPRASLCPFPHTLGRCRQCSAAGAPFQQDSA